MEKQLSLELEKLSSGKLNNTTLKKPLSSKAGQKLKQPVSKLLPKKEKELNLKSLSLEGVKTEGKPRALPYVHSPRKEHFFGNRIYKLLSTREASGLLGVSENALRILVCRKKVKAYKLGSRLKFKLEDLMTCLQKKEV